MLVLFLLVTAGVTCPVKFFRLRCAFWGSVWSDATPVVSNSHKNVQLSFMVPPTSQKPRWLTMPFFALPGPTLLLPSMLASVALNSFNHGQMYPPMFPSTLNVLAFNLSSRQTCLPWTLRPITSLMLLLPMFLLLRPVLIQRITLHTIKP